MYIAGGQTSFSWTPTVASYSFIVYDIYILYAEKGKREDNERDEKMSTVDERRPREMMTMRDGGDFDCWRIDRLKSSKID